MLPPFCQFAMEMFAGHLDTDGRVDSEGRQLTHTSPELHWCRRAPRLQTLRRESRGAHLRPRWSYLSRAWAARVARRPSWAAVAAQSDPAARRRAPRAVGSS